MLSQQSFFVTSYVPVSDRKENPLVISQMKLSISRREANKRRKSLPSKKTFHNQWEANQVLQK